ncbi:MAG: Rieske 2Fe-2S domain-containing protein [Chloroflexota bacterium]|nr:MAG: iron-sulfur protein [Chloroflexota bacterium]
MFRSLDRFIEEQSWLDTIGDPLQGWFKALFQMGGGTGKRVQNLLNGTWLGHPLHPMVTDVPVGSWTATMVLDAVGATRDDDAMSSAADITLGIGWAAAVASIATGWAQWSYTSGKDRRVGLLHALTMATSFVVYTASLTARLRGARGTGVALANTGYLVMAAGAYLGGEEAFDIGFGVNHTAFEQGPGDYVAVMSEADLQANALTKVDAGGVSVLLVKLNNGIFALDDTCTHAGCSLAGGKLDGLSVICPCHGSQFDLRDGEVINGPATYREPSYFVRVRDGMVEVKRGL